MPKTQKTKAAAAGAKTVAETVAKKKTATRKSLKSAPAKVTPVKVASAKSAPAKAAKASSKKKPAVKTGVVSRKKTTPAKFAKKAPAKKVPVKNASAKKTASALKPVAVKKINLATGAQLELLKRIAVALDDKKAEDLRVIYIGDKSDVTDYLVIATGNSEPQLRALRIAAEKAAEDVKGAPVRSDSQPGSGWNIVDTFDVMIHLFSKEQRAYYKLESLWKDGVDLPVKSLL